MTEEAMNEGSMTHDVTNADGALEAGRRVSRPGRQPRASDRPVDDVDAVLCDTMGQQINALPTTMTAAEALEDSLGPHR